VNWNEHWGELIIEELVRHDTECFCISPGSRSAPLTVAVAKNPRAKSVIFYDERAAAYYALGHARASGRPAVLICTSGTAAANYLPAVIEASVDQIPLLVLTSDRPPELRETGANQAINQTFLFGTHVRWFFDPGCPCSEFTTEALLSTIDHAVSKTLQPLPGPVHLNFPFREPFFENAEKQTNNKVETITAQKVYVRNTAFSKVLPDSEIKELLKNRPESGILSIGRVPADSLDSLKNLAEELAWPVFADVTSGLRLGENCPNRITYYDQLLIEDMDSANWEIEAVWHIGFPPTSKRWLTHWGENPATQMVWIADHAERHDQSHNFRWKIECGIAEFCEQFVAELKLAERADVIPLKTQQWLQASAKVEAVMEQHFPLYSEKKEIDDFALSRRLTEIIPETHGFFIGNSIPVRAVDMLGSGKGAEIPAALNRSASGIDGLIASACGYSSGLQRPVSLLIGDLSAIHDLNSFKLLADSSEPVFVVLLNNHGGGIFSFLPVAKQTDIFETFFGTPHSNDFLSVAEMFGLNYFRPDSISAFVKDYRQAVIENKSAVIEIFTERDKNSQQLEALAQKLMKCAFESS
tara:strand:+ start:1149 stop:2897 length:1749 start_codon:yes stop_codon:yes gene_type:complete